MRGLVHSSNGIEEEGYLALCGQQQYYLIRGENVNKPVVIWIHGGPASPDTMLTYAFTDYLKDDYTVVAWNQRGCGRTYYKNKEIDPYNETATFEQALSLAKEKGDDTEAMAAAFEAYQADASLENMMALRNYALPYHTPEKESNYIWTALTTPYLGVDDVLWFGKQVAGFSDFTELNGQLFDYISSEDVYAYGTAFRIPVGFISGSCDWVTPVQYTEDYYHTITAPEKEMRLIDGWGHTVPQENPKEFADTFRQVMNEILY